MKKIERNQLAQIQIGGGSKGNSSQAIASGNGTANATTIIVKEKIVIRLF
jgi:hypothetical protein